MAWGDFWEPGNTYGSPDGQDWYNTPLSEIGARDNPSGTFFRWLTDRNATGFGRRDSFVQSLRDRFNQGYSAALQSNPFLTYRDYQAGFDDNFVDQQWNELSPEQKGRNYGRFAPRMRIQGRG